MHQKMGKKSNVNVRHERIRASVASIREINGQLTIESSFRPDVFPLSKSRLVKTSSGHSKNSTRSTTAASPTTSFQALTFPSLLGNPSIKNLAWPFFVHNSSIAFLISCTVISEGTILPKEILELIISASSDPSFCRSARSKSPAERWAQCRFLESSSHCVP